METQSHPGKTAMRIKVSQNGPYQVFGGVPLIELHLTADEEGLSTGYRETRRYETPQYYELCRCGDSDNKPFCDNTHELFGFNGTETAGNIPFMEQIEPPTTGPEITLLDVVRYCASARFCDRNGGAWDRTRQSDDPESKAIATEIIFNCPAGRLALLNKQGQVLEPHLEPSIAVIYDDYKDRIGPIWVRGGIPIESANGTFYEVRNRVTLCRCGQSKNKPFCDGSHVDL
jgi:CDGSH-type Zn-finger protein